MSGLAVLVMDFQRTMVERFATDAHLAAARRVRDAARAAGACNVLVGVQFRAHHPEIGERAGFFTHVRESGSFTAADPGSALHDGLGLDERDVVVLKRRVSAFASTDLDLVLRARGVTRLALAGISTSGVVLSTLRSAIDLDYELVVLEDLCLDGDPVVQDTLMTRVFPRHATITTSAQFTAELEAAGHARG